MKCTLSDAGTGVALIIRPPGGIVMRRTDARVSHIDIFPTVCELPALPAPTWLSGHSLAPLVEGRTASVRGELYSEITFHASYEPLRCIRTRHYKYIKNFNPSANPILPNIDDCLSKSYMLAQTGLLTATPAEQLFDVPADPAEAHDIAQLPAYSEIKQDLARRLADWMRDTDDPLLNGPVPRRPGARITKSSALSPTDAEYD